MFSCPSYNFGEVCYANCSLNCHILTGGNAATAVGAGGYIRTCIHFLSLSIASYAAFRVAGILGPIPALRAKVVHSHHEVNNANCQRVDPLLLLGK